MPSFIMLLHLGQLLIRLWIGHMLNTWLLTLIMQLYSGFLHLLRHILFYNLQISFLNIASNSCSLLTVTVATTNNQTCIGYMGSKDCCLSWYWLPVVRVVYCSQKPIVPLFSIVSMLCTALTRPTVRVAHAEHPQE